MWSKFISKTKRKEFLATFVAIFFLGFVNRETMNDKPKRMIDIDNVDNRPKISHKIVNRNLV